MILTNQPTKITLQDYLPNAGAEYNMINEVNMGVYDFYENNTYNVLLHNGPKIDVSELQFDKVYEVTLTDEADPDANGLHNLIKHVKIIKITEESPMQG